jgi:hypothetical protein
VLFLLLLVMVALLTVAWALGRTPAPQDGVPLGPVETDAPAGTAATPAARPGPPAVLDGPGVRFVGFPSGIRVH